MVAFKTPKHKLFFGLSFFSALKGKNKKTKT